MKTLQDIFGKKTGESLYKFARGIDDRPLSSGQPRQSVSAEVSVSGCSMWKYHIYTIT
jgi:nucleotidyltransferase/DNA polymerase involved in DNA repair